MPKLEAYMGTDADHEGIVLEFPIGRATDHLGPGFRALKAAGIKPDQHRGGWMFFRVDEREISIADGKKILRAVLEAAGYDVRGR